MHTILDQLKGQLIVSCQALPDEPLYGASIMGKLALAAAQSGAKGIRANSICDIQEIKKNVSLPIIGIIKQNYDDNPVFITPTLTEIDALVTEGVAIIATAATDNIRPTGQNTSEFFAEVRKKYPQQLFMADVSTLDEAIAAEKMGFDIVAPTLLGNTPQTKGQEITDNDFKLLRDILQHVTIPVIAEGGISTPQIAKKVLDMGVFAIVVGGAITRPQQLTKNFIEEMGLPVPTEAWSHIKI